MLATIILRDASDANRLWSLLRDQWRTAAADGHPLVVTVHPHSSRRTIAQNALLHALLTEIAQVAWVDGRRWSMEVWKTYFKRKYLGTVEFPLPDGEIIERERSTADLNVQEFATFINQITVEAEVDLGLELIH